MLPSLLSIVGSHRAARHCEGAWPGAASPPNHMAPPEGAAFEHIRFNWSDRRQAQAVNYAPSGQTSQVSTVPVGRRGQLRGPDHLPQPMPRVLHASTDYVSLGPYGKQSHLLSFAAHPLALMSFLLAMVSSPDHMAYPEGTACMHRTCEVGPLVQASSFADCHSASCFADTM